MAYILVNIYECDVVKNARSHVTTKQLEFLSKVQHQKPGESPESYENEFIKRDVTFLMLI